MTRKQGKVVFDLHQDLEKERQKLCHHDFPQVGGQWDINGNLHLICTRCLENRTYLAPDAFERSAYAAHLNTRIGGQGYTNIVFLNRKEKQNISWRFIFELIKGKLNIWKMKFT